MEYAIAERFEITLGSPSFFLEAYADTSLNSSASEPKVIAIFRKPDPHTDEFLRLTSRDMQTPLLVVDAAGPCAREALSRFGAALEGIEIGHFIWSWRTPSSLSGFDPAFGFFLLTDDEATDEEIRALVTRTPSAPDEAYFRCVITTGAGSLVKGRYLDKLVGVSSTCGAMPIISLGATQDDAAIVGLRTLSALLLPMLHSYIGCADWGEYAMLFKHTPDAYTIASWADERSAPEFRLLGESVYALEPFHGEITVRSALCGRISSKNYSMEKFEDLSAIANQMGFYDFEFGGVALSVLEPLEGTPGLPLGVCSFEVFTTRP